MKSPFITATFAIFTCTLFAQAPPSVDFTHLEATISVNPLQEEVSGEILFKFDILEPVDSIFIDARKMYFSEVFLNGMPTDFGADDKRFWISGNFDTARNQELSLKYVSQPKQAMYFIKNNSAQFATHQVWTQGQGRYTSHWLPSFDDPTEKLEFDLSFIYDSGQTVISNGELLEKTEVSDSLNLWKFDMEHPMSSYLVAFAAGPYEKEIERSGSDVELEYYYNEGLKNRVEPTYRHTAFMMDFLEQKTGFPYPWQNYKQIPVQDFLYAGMENTGATIFSDMFVVDSIGYNDQNYVNVNAHELAHQWFGNVVTAASREDHWLQEGLATYYALLAEKEIFGEDYYYRKLFITAEELKKQSDAGKGSPVVTPNGNSLTYYQKGAWALHILNELIGEEAFNQGINNYLVKYQFKTASTLNFIKEMEASSKMELSEFVKTWLKQSAFQGTEALNSLKKSPFILSYLELAAAKSFPLENKKGLLKESLSFPVNDYLGQEAVLQLALENPVDVIDLYKMAFSSGNIYTRQAIALSLQRVPQQLKSEYESLLNDDSYLTKEAALYNLWSSFPKERLKYLNLMKGIEGLPNKNIETLWLALHLATPEVDAVSKRAYFTKLSQYTAPHQKFQIRENAFDFLHQLIAFDNNSLKNLVEASQHFNYRFRNFAKNLLKTMIEEGQLREDELKQLQADFKEEQR